MGSLWPGAPNLMEFNRSLAIVPLEQCHYRASQYEFFIGPRKELISVKNLLTRLSEAKKSATFVIMGPRGSGKTVLMKQVSTYWAKQYTLREFPLVLYINLKSSDPDATLQDIVQSQFPGVVTENVWQWIEQRKGKGVLFIMDGYEKDQDIGLEMSTNITTSTQFRQGLPSKLCNIRLFGLSDAQIAKRAVTSLGPEHASDFLLYLSENPVIRSLISSPVYLAAVIYVFTHAQPDQLPKTWTHLFASLTYQLVLNASGKELKLPRYFTPHYTVLPRSRHSLKIKTLIKTLFRRHQATEAENQADVDFALQQFCLMGIHVMSHEVIQSTSSHKSFTADYIPPASTSTTVPLLQEFLAAWWIHVHSANVSVSYSSYPYIWQFYAGLNDASASRYLLGDHLDDTMGIVNCLSENAAGEVTKGPLCNVICIKNELLTVRSISHICWCLPYTTDPLLEIKHCILEPAALQELFKYLAPTCCLPNCNHFNLTVLR